MNYLFPSIWEDVFFPGSYPEQDHGQQQTVQHKPNKNNVTGLQGGPIGRNAPNLELRILLF